MKIPCPDYERDLAAGRPVIGVDEVGRGPLAGPVIAAAAFLPDPRAIDGLRDSKALSEKKRNALSQDILANAQVALGGASSQLIDLIGIEAATQLAMKRAVARLGVVREALILVDGNRAPDFGAPTRTEVKADASCPSVSAAAIVAKVARDRAMIMLSQRHGAYGWGSNKGYGSKQHRDAILTDGVTPHHRMSFLTKILASA